jgi:hypothetical protein
MKIYMMPGEEGVHRSAQQCKGKWEKFTAEFKKSLRLSYEKNIPSADDKH